MIVTRGRARCVTAMSTIATYTVRRPLPSAVSPAVTSIAWLTNHCEGKRKAELMQHVNAMEKDPTLFR